MSAPKDADLCRKDCQFYRPSSVFEECTHPRSEYTDNHGKAQFHTIAHMLGGLCFLNSLYQPKERKSWVSATSTSG